MRKVCIVGFSPSSRDDAPFGDTSFEFWGMNNLHAVTPNKLWDRWFDMHQRDYIDANNPNLSTDHIEWLMTTTIPVYMQRKFEEFPTSVAFPIQEIQERMRKDWGFEPGEENYFHSTFAYPMALAIHEGVDEIHLYGLDMVKESEYGYQRPNAEGWICLARQQPAKSFDDRKIRVVIADRCALLKGPGLYGYDEQGYALPTRIQRALKDDLQTHRQQWLEANEKVKEARRELHVLEGVCQVLERWAMRMDDIKRGADP